MKFSDRIKTYNFWVSIASAIFLILNLIGKRFNFTIDESAYNDMFTTFCSILVLLGIIVPPTNFKGQFYNHADNFDYFENDTETNKIDNQNGDEIVDNKENNNEKIDNQ